MADIEGHFRYHLGQPEFDRDVRGVGIWCHRRPEWVSYATHGLSSVDTDAPAPQELVCSVQHGQEGAALELVLLTLDMVLARRHGLVDNQLIRNDQGPLLLQTRISGVLISSHPYLEDEFDFLLGDDGSMAVDIKTIIPVTDTEIVRADVDGVDALVDILEITDPSLLDITRS